MKTLSFTDQEAHELSQFYRKKLEEAEKRLLSIKGILLRLSEANLIDVDVVDSSAFISEIDESADIDDDGPSGILYENNLNTAITAEDDVIVTSEIQQVDGLEIDEQTIDITRYNWIEFFRWTLTTHETVYTMAELVDLGISCYNLNKNEKGKIQKKLTPFFTHLLKSGEFRKFNLDDQPGYYYGLSDWFLKNGRVKKPYVARFSDDNKKNKPLQRFHENDLQNFAAVYLFEMRKMLTFSELVDAAKDQFGFPESDRHIFVFNFKDEINRMTSVNQLIPQKVVGKGDIFYALPSWFKTNGEIRKPFIM